MLGASTFPGVYIEEIPSGVRTTSGVATSITAALYFPRVIQPRPETRKPTSSST